MIGNGKDFYESAFSGEKFDYAPEVIGKFIPNLR